MVKKKSLQSDNEPVTRGEFNEFAGFVRDTVVTKTEFNRLETKVDGLENRFTDLSNRFTDLSNRFTDLSNQMLTGFDAVLNKLESFKEEGAAQSIINNRFRTWIKELADLNNHQLKD